MFTTHSTTPTGAPAIAALSLSDSAPKNAPKRAAWISPKAPYFQTENALIDRAGKHIGVYGIAVYIAIERHADFASGESYPTIEMLMAEIGISEPTACKYVAMLESCGMISKRTSYWGSREQGPRSRNFYRVLRSSEWDFSSLENLVKSDLKQIEVGLKQIGANKKNKIKKNVKQQTTKGAGARKNVGTPTVVDFSNEAVPASVCSPPPNETKAMIPDETAALAEALYQAGCSREYAERIAAQDPDECRLQLARLARQKTPPGSPGGWLRRAIAGHYRDETPVPGGPRAKAAPTRPYSPVPIALPSPIPEPVLVPERHHSKVEAERDAEIQGVKDALKSRKIQALKRAPLWAPEAPFDEADYDDSDDETARLDAANDAVFETLPGDEKASILEGAQKQLPPCLRERSMRNSPGARIGMERERRALVWRHHREKIYEVAGYSSENDSSENNSAERRH